MNRFVVAVVAVVGLCAVQAATAATAVAHATLESSSPASGATLDTLPTDIELVFSENVGKPAALAVLAPDGDPVETGELSVIDDTMRASLLGGSSRPGEYTISYEVRSADGHSITGSVRFTVQGDDLAVTSPPGAHAGEANETYVEPRVVGLLAFVLIAALGAAGTATMRLVRNLDERPE